MANFLRNKQAGIQTDLSAGIEPPLFVLDDIIRYGINSQITTIAHDPVQSLLAVGTHDSAYGTGQIYVFGRKRVCVTLTLPRKATVKSIHFCAEKLISVDSKNEIVLFSLETRRVLATYTPPGSVTAVSTDPCLDWAFLGLQNGDIVVYDLDREVLAPLRMPYLWREKNPRARPQPVVSLALHPKDIGSLLVGYTEGAAIFSFKQNRAVKFLQYEVPPGAPGGDSDPASMRKMRYPRLSQALWHPTGTFILTGHEDSSLVFWDVKTSKIIAARTIQDTNVHMPGASSGTVGVTPGTFSLKEPLFRIAWCAKQNPEDTGILIAGGSPTTNPTKGLTYLDLGMTPVYATSSWQILSDHFNSPKRQRILPTPPGAEVVDFCLVSESSPHYAGAHDPIAVMALLSSGGVGTLSFPSGHPISPTNHVHPSVSFVHPFVDRLNVTQVERTRWLGMVEHRQDGPALINGGAEVHHPMKRFASRSVVQTAHADGTIRLWDAGHADEIENPDVVQADVALALGRIDEVDTTAMSMSGVTGEFVTGVSTGEVVVFRWGGNRHFGRPPNESIEGSPRGLTDIADRADPKLREGLLPLAMFNPQQGPVTAVKMSDVGFLAMGFESGHLAIIDLRGPAVIYATSVSSGPPASRRSGLGRRSNSHQLPPSQSQPEHVTALEFAVMTLEGDDYSSILLLAGTSHARLLPHKLLPSANGGYTVSPTPPTVLASPTPSSPIVSISPFSPLSGKPTPATPSALSSLRSGAKFPGCLLVTTPTTAFLLLPSSSSHPPKPSHRDFPDIFLLSSAVVLLEDAVIGNRTCLVGLFGDGTARAFSIPGLKEIGRANVSKTLETARLSEARITPAGEIVAWTGPSEIGVLNVWGTGQPLPKSHDRLYNAEVGVPARPTISNLQWIAGTQFVGPADMDLLIGGPDRPPSRRMLAQQSSQQQASAAVRQTAGPSGPTPSSSVPGGPDESWGNYMSRQLAERTEKLNIVGDSMDNLQENSAGWARDVSKYVAGARKKVLVGAAKKSVGL